MKAEALTDADWEAFRAFAEEEFGRSHVPDRRFNEHWFKSPYNGGEWSARISREPDGSVSGAMMFLVQPAWFEGQEARMAWISSGVVREAARLRGEGAALYFWGYRNFPLVGALSGNEFSNPINDRLGVRLPGVAIRRFLFVHRAETAELCQPEKRGRIDLARFPLAGSDLEAAWLDRAPEDHDALWRKVREGILFTTDRTTEFYRWRYEEAPYLSYRFLPLRRRGTLVGTAVARFQETPAGQVCRIVDFVAATEDAADCWRALLGAAAESGALFTDFLVIGTTQDRALLDAGFQPADETSGFDCVPHLLSPVEHRAWSNTAHFGGRLAQQSQAWRRADALYFTKGDSDRDWPTAHDLERLGVAA